ncbi:MAG TPA: CTP synthetase [Alphaproteobacteria bacterium]|nr:CTP synthetase [Alphaproteobacteria bacterium]
MTKYIFITGGVVSSLGKGMASAAIGALLQARGFKVRMRKMDPYLNIDPGTMSPFQHGEVFVTDDGAETDLDLGHYERFIGNPCHKTDSISGGRIYYNVLMKERRGEYLGATVQAIPHVTDEIKHFIESDLTDEDFVMYEIGGTVGDIEGTLFLEAIRQYANQVGKENCLFLHLTLLPYIPTAGELKTKPTQHSVKQLLETGIQPNILLCRSAVALSESERAKIALFCNIAPQDVIAALDADSIYKIPLQYHEAGLDDRILHYFKMDNANKPDLSRWENIVNVIGNWEHSVSIAVVGKYCGLLEAYKSLNEAIFHAGIAHKTKVNVKWIESDTLEGKTPEQIAETFADVQGILVPGGFGTRGVEGKMLAEQFAREHKLPFFGICLGMQTAVIEAARHLLGIADASSTEFTKDCTPVVALMTEWEQDGKKQIRSEKTDVGGTMRLGAYPCRLKAGSLAAKLYDNAAEIHERHRHRYEVNMDIAKRLEEKGLQISGVSPDGLLPEIVELKDHPFYLAVQFHPEFKSRAFAPHPLFKGFIKAALDQTTLL